MHILNMKDIKAFYVEKDGQLRVAFKRLTVKPNVELPLSAGHVTRAAFCSTSRGSFVSGNWNFLDLKVTLDIFTSLI